MALEPDLHSSGEGAGWGRAFQGRGQKVQRSRGRNKLGRSEMKEGARGWAEGVKRAFPGL